MTFTSPFLFSAVRQTGSLPRLETFACFPSDHAVFSFTNTLPVLTTKSVPHISGTLYQIGLNYNSYTVYFCRVLLVRFVLFASHLLMECCLFSCSFCNLHNSFMVPPVVQAACCLFPLSKHKIFLQDFLHHQKQCPF